MTRFQVRSLGCAVVGSGCLQEPTSLLEPRPSGQDSPPTQRSSGSQSSRPSSAQSRCISQQAALALVRRLAAILVLASQFWTVSSSMASGGPEGPNHTGEIADLGLFLRAHPPSDLMLRGGTPLFPPGATPDEAFVEFLIREASKRGILLSAQEVLEAAHLFRTHDSPEQMVDIARILPLLALAGSWCVRGAMQSVAISIGVNAVFGQETTLKDVLREAALGCLLGGSMGGLKHAHKALLRGPTYSNQASQVVDRLWLWTEVSTDVATNAIELAQAQLVAQFQNDLSGDPDCLALRNLRGAYSSSYTTISTAVEDCLSPNFQARWGSELVNSDLVIPTLEIDFDPLAFLELSTTDGTHLTNLLPDSSTIDVNLAVAPLEAGSATISLFARHEGSDFNLRSWNISFSAADVGSVFTTTLSLPGSELLALSPSANRTFQLWTRSSMNSHTADYFGPNGSGVLLQLDGSSNVAPRIFVSHTISGNTARFAGSYRDLDGNSPTRLRVIIQGSSGQQILDVLPFLSPGPNDSQREFDRPITLANGSYTYYLETSDGLASSQTKVTGFRSSSSVPVIQVNLASATGDVGQIIAGSISATDAAGPIPVLEIGLQSDLNGVFLDSQGRMVRKVLTNAAGVASFSYRPEISGNHTVLAMEPEHHRYGWDTLEVDGNPSDWTTDWSWSLLSSTGSPATYEVQVLIRYQGQNLSNGDYVFFSANHGTFADDEDQVGSSSIAVNQYTLTSDEANLGSEVITLDLPEYGVSLQHVVDLPVGNPTSLAAPRELFVSASNDGNDSFAVAVSQNGQYLAYANDDDVVVLNLTDLSPIRTVDTSGDTITCVGFSPDGTRVAAGDNDGNISVVNVASGAASIASKTNGSADIINLHWYSANRMAVVTGGHSSTGYTPKFMILNDSLGNVLAPIGLSGVTSTEELRRVRCSATSQLCAMATDYDDARWFLLTSGGSVVYTSPVHPDQDMFRAFAFNAAGDRLFVGGENNNGAVMADLYAVTSSSVTPLTDPFTASSDVFAASFVMDAGVERLALGGNSFLELFPVSGGAALRSISDPVWQTSESYYLDFLGGPQILAAVTNAEQALINLSSDQIGPAISIVEPPALPYAVDSALVRGSATDPSGVAVAEFQMTGGPWQPLALGAGGSFEFALTSLPVGETTGAVRAVDTRFNVTLASFSVIRSPDSTAPLLSDMAAHPLLVAPGALVTVRCLAEDLESGVAAVSATVRLAGSEVHSLSLPHEGGGTYRASFSTTGWVDGLYTVDYSATDAASPSNTATVTGGAFFEVDASFIFMDGFETGDVSLWSSVVN